MLRAKVASGKSLIFVAMICFGYRFGISSKLLAWQNGAELSVLIWVYSWNFLITVFDAALVMHYSQAGGWKSCQPPRSRPATIEPLVAVGHSCSDDRASVAAAAKVMCVLPAERAGSTRESCQCLWLAFRGLG
ncbi:MAG: hypothetical protein AAF637_18915 [Pseudomonadota bacterium]